MITRAKISTVRADSLIRGRHLIEGDAYSSKYGNHAIHLRYILVNLDIWNFPHNQFIMMM